MIMMITMLVLDTFYRQYVTSNQVLVHSDSYKISGSQFDLLYIWYWVSQVNGIWNPPWVDLYHHLNLYHTSFGSYAYLPRAINGLSVYGTPHPKARMTVEFPGHFFW